MKNKTKLWIGVGAYLLTSAGSTIASNLTASAQKLPSSPSPTQIDEARDVVDNLEKPLISCNEAESGQEMEKPMTPLSEAGESDDSMEKPMTPSSEAGESDDGMEKPMPPSSSEAGESDDRMEPMTPSSEAGESDDGMEKPMPPTNDAGEGNEG